MADIDQILAGGAGASTRADFSGLANLPEMYWKGKDRAFTQEARDLFKGGVPKNADGSINYGAMRDALFQHGDVATGSAIDNLDLKRQQLKYGLDAASKDFPPPPPPPSPLVSPPSANRSGETPVAPPLNRGGETRAPAAFSSGGPQGDQPGSIVGLVSAAGIPDELAGPVIQQVSALTRTDPNIALNPEVSQRVQQVVAAAAQRMKAGQPQGQPQQPPQPQPIAQAQPQPAPQPVQPAPSFNDRFAGQDTLGGLVPAGRTPQQQLDMLSRRVASGLLSPEVAKVYETRIKAIQDYLQPTQDMKNAKASGQSLPDYQNRSDENTTQRDILTKSLLPKVDASQEKASAARDDINSIHASREQLDANGGVFSGSFADQKLYLSKVASMFGIDDSRIANTEAYGAAIGQRVASMVKAFGSGTAISDGDRKFAAAMAGGNITLDEKSMRRILDIGEKAARGRIDQHNGLVDRIVGANEAMKAARDTYIVKAPGEYKKAAAADPFAKARAAIAAGAPRDAVAARLKQAGHDPSKL